VKIEYSTDGGVTYPYLIVASYPSTSSSYTWTVPSTPSTQCKVKISDAETGTPSNVSNGVFTIFTSVGVDVPNGGEAWGAGEPRFIVWHGSTPTSSPVKIEYSTNGGSSWSTVVASTPNDGTYQWTVPSTLSTQCKVKVSDAATGTPSDVSNGVFTISTSITVDVPNGGEVWGVGEPRFIVWHGSTLPSSPVKIEYSTDGGTTWSTVAASTPNDGTYKWTVPSTPSTQCLVKISDVSSPGVVDVSDTNFTIQETGIARGDVDDDGAIDVIDARLCLQIALGVIEGTPEQREQADVDGDGDVDMDDARALARSIIGM